MPGVAEPDGAPDPRLAVAADPDGNRGGVLACLLVPGFPQGDEILVGQPAARGKRHAERLELLTCPADAHPEHEAGHR